MRGGLDIADRVPEIRVLSNVGVDVVLRGELVAGGGPARPTLVVLPGITRV